MYAPGELSGSTGLSGIKLLTSVEGGQDHSWSQLFKFEGVMKDDDESDFLTNVGKDGKSG
jgi:hypothetical protein